MQIPSNGDVHSLRAVLDRLDLASIDVDALTVHTPDLDDVFLALTGHRPDTSRPDGANRRTTEQNQELVR